MVLAKLPCGVALRFQEFGDGRVFGLQTDRRSGHAHFGEAGPNRILSGDKAGATGGAALLRIVVGKQSAFIRDAIDVGRTIAHHSITKATNVPNTDIIAPQNEDVRFLARHMVEPFFNVAHLNAKALAASVTVKLYRSRAR